MTVIPPPAPVSLLFTSPPPRPRMCCAVQGGGLSLLDRYQMWLGLKHPSEEDTLLLGALMQPPLDLLKEEEEASSHVRGVIDAIRRSSPVLEVGTPRGQGGQGGGLATLIR